MISRKQLYAAGEPLGDSATRRKLGGGYLCGMGGGGGSSESSTASNTSTVNKDARQVLDGGAVGISGDGNSLGISSTTNNDIHTVDSTSIAAGRDIALSSIANNSTNTEHLLAASELLFSQIGKSVQSSMDLTKSLSSTASAAFSDATAQATGNKQLMMVGLAVIGLAAVTMAGKK